MDHHHCIEGHLKEILTMVGVAHKPAQLEAMGLTAASIQHPVEAVSLTSYTRRLGLQNAVIATNQEGRITPIGDIIFSTAPAAHSKFARCNYSVSLVQCNGSIPGAGEAGAALAIAPDTYMFFNEHKLWSEKYLTSSFEDFRNLLVASRPDGYRIDDYFKFVPKNVLSSNVHQTANLNKRKATHQALTMDMITFTYIYDF